ncbi:MAG: SpoVR family protein, partial [Planctomycetota bacterium]
MQRSRLSPELAAWAERIRGWAEGYGLDFYEVVFELVSHDELNQVAAYGGFPTRYPHWRFGMSYERLSKGYTWGLHKIYELVINNDPTIAYLLRSNALVEQKMVMAHVFGHADFFKNNAWFRHTNRKMLDEMANHATRVRRYIEQYGLETVERFLDDCLALENLIDLHRPFIRRTAPRPEPDREPERPVVPKLRAKRYMDPYLNPPEYVEAERRRIEAELEKRRKHPAEPERDVLLFLLENAPLERWQRDVLDMVREEAYYFAPQGQTKILNEGWASYWHSTIMTRHALEDSELIDYAANHAGTMGSQPGALNPYKVGLELLR